MLINKKFFHFLLIFTLSGFAGAASAKEQYPNISGKALMELRSDRVMSGEEGVKSNNVDVNVDSEFALNFNKNWAVVTSWMIRQVARDEIYPERYRTILSSNREVGFNNEGLIVEQLKGQFQNEDLRVVFGKFNPAFGTAHRKEKRIGVFTTDFTKDYELREKIGASISALLEKSQIDVATFFNDTTGLSNSAIKRRGRAKSGDGIAGNNTTLSSVAFSVEGQDLFGVNDLFYNVGYRNLNTENLPGSDNETGYVGGLEYSIPLGLRTSLIPFIEIAKINNLSGASDRNALYTTMALVGKYSGWTASVSNVIRNIRQKNEVGNVRDSQLQLSVGYKFTNNIALDVSRMSLKENHDKAVLMGAVLSYVYNF